MNKNPLINIDIQRKKGEYNFSAKIQTDGGLTAFFGQSGSGKTSLIKMIAGLDTPDAGIIIIDGHVLFDSKRKINMAPEKRKIGYIFQDGRLFPHLNVYSNLIYARRFMCVALNPHKFDAVINLLGLKHLLDRRPTTLSGGEQQRVAIGRALLAEPQLLLMDEPLASLDFARKAEILPFIENLRDQLKTPIFYVSHAIEEVIRLADTMVLLDRGNTIAQGEVEDLMSRLDLRPLTGKHETGAVLSVNITAQDSKYGLTELSFKGHTLFIPHINFPIGTHLRMRIWARDVSLSKSKPSQTSILNVFEATIREISPNGLSQCEILLDIGTPLIALITRKSVIDLKLEVGGKVYAQVKAAAIDRRILGPGPTHVSKSILM
jgi:molybdate transport system ATP-binding protein